MTSVGRGRGTLTGPQQPVPWWVLPAIVLAGLAGAAATRWWEAPPAHDGRAPAMPSIGASAPAAPAAPAVPVRTAGVPAVEAESERIVVSGVLLVDGSPSLAVVTVGAAPPRLLRVGDAARPGATLLRIDADRVTVTDGSGVRTLAVSGPPTELQTRAALPVTGVAASASREPAASVPPPEYGAIALPQVDPAAGRGNAAFRAAVEAKARAMKP